MASALDLAGYDFVETYARIDFVSALMDATDAADPRRVRPKGLPPVKGQFGLRVHDPRGDRWSAELYLPWAGGIDPSDYNAAERRNTQSMPPDGLPGYVPVGLRGRLRLDEGITLAHRGARMHARRLQERRAAGRRRAARHLGGD